MVTKIKDKIISPASKFILEDSKIKKYYFLPGLLSIIFLTVLLVYQSIYTYVELFGNKEKALLIILEFFHSDYLFEIAIGAIIFIVLYIFIIPIFEGGLISYLNKKTCEDQENIGCSDAVSHGVFKFLPLFEYNNIFSEFKFMSVINAYLFCIRFVGIKYIDALNILFLFLLILSTIINVLFAYSKYYIVIENKKVMKAIAYSSKLAILNIVTTIKLYFFMFILNTRVIINFLVFLIFPVLIVSVLTYITSKIFILISIFILSIIFILLILFLGYLNGVLEIFKTAIWYFAYKEGKKKLDIDK